MDKQDELEQQKENDEGKASNRILVFLAISLAHSEWMVFFRILHP